MRGGWFKIKIICEWNKDWIPIAQYLRQNTRLPRAPATVCTIIILQYKTYWTGESLYSITMASNHCLWLCTEHELFYFKWYFNIKIEEKNPKSQTRNVHLETVNFNFRKFQWKMTASSGPLYNLCQLFQVKLVFSNTFAEHSEPAVAIYISKDIFRLFFIY